MDNNIELSYISPVFQNIENNDLSNLLKKYERFDKKILEKILFIFIDDHSPIPVEIHSKKINYDLYRINSDILWNQGGARNLGATMARSQKLILTDLDHFFPEKVFDKLIYCKVPRKIYKFRRKLNGVKTNRHPNTFFCSKSTFFKSLGVDEEFCGRYGYEDLYFMELQKAVGTKIGVFPEKYSLETQKHEQHNLVRDFTENEKILNRKRKSLNSKKPFEGHSRLFLNFDWKIKDSYRVP